VRVIVTAILKRAGIECDTAASLAETREALARRRYDILVADVHLADGSGLSLLQPGAEAPLAIIMTGQDDLQLVVDAIRGGAADFIQKPFGLTDFLQRFEALRSQWKARWRLQRAGRALETLVRIKSDEVSRTSRRFGEVRDMTVAAMGAALGLKDNETADHCTRVSRNSVALGRRLSLSEFELQNLEWGAFLHDVGKIGVPEHILLKPGALELEERRIMQRHPVMGYEMLGGIRFLEFATDVVQSHHERYDGAGYPHRLARDRIPLNARIFSLLDTLDAMTSDRPYRAASSVWDASREIERMAGTQFDPAIVEVFLAAPREGWLIQGTRHAA
jgi:putative nucleotidyltransferase with HDIG domain